MDENNITIDQSVLAEDVSSKIKYDFYDYFLVKPLDPVKVTKEFSKPVSSNYAPTEDANGVIAQDFDKVETEVKEVDSDFRRGIVLKRPLSYERQLADPEIGEAKLNLVEIGNIVIFRDRMGLPFDLLKDSRLIRAYDIIAVER